MTNSLQVNELMGELTGRTVEVFSLWADANQKVLRELVDLSAGTAREGVRLYAEIQSATLEAIKEGQAYLLRRQDAMRSPLHSPWQLLQMHFGLAARFRCAIGLEASSAKVAGPSSGSS